MPADTEMPEAGIGHNNPPELPVPEAIDDYLAAQYRDVLTRASDLLAAESRFVTVGSDDQDKNATEFMVKVRTGWKTAEAGRVAEKAPYDERAGRVHAFFKTNVLDPLEAMGKRINDAQTAYKLGVLRATQEHLAAEERKRRAAEQAAATLAAEEKRKADELAAQLARARKPERVAELTAAAEEAAGRAQETAQAANQAAESRAEVTAAIAAPAADKTRNRGGRGGVSSLVGTTTFRDLDPATIDLEKLRDVFTIPQLTTAMNAWIKANKGMADKAAASTDAKDQPITGVVIYTDYQNRGRQ